MMQPDMDGTNLRPMAERSGSIDSDASVSELRPSPESTDNSPSPSAQSVPSEPELPDDLKAQGWMVHYSRKSRRYYFYHPARRESYWYIIDIRRHAVRAQDPLRIDHDPTTSPPAPTTPPIPSPSFNPLKRSASEPHPETLLVKRPHSFKFYDFDIQSTIYMLERKPLHIPRSHPETELLRHKLMGQLAKRLNEMCLAREGIEPPAMSLQRWLLERKVFDKGIDPVFPSKCVMEVSHSLAREIMNNIPMPLIKPKYAADARKQLIKYIEAARRFVERRQMASDSRKKILITCESMMKLLRTEAHVTLEVYVNRLALMKRDFQSAIMDAAEQSVHNLTVKLYNQCVAYAAEVYDQYKKIVKEQNFSLEDRWKTPERMERKCYPIYLSHPDLAHPAVEVMRDDSDQAKFIYKGEAVVINKTHLCKLERLYACSHPEDADYRLFPSRTWCMLMRYQMLFGPAMGDAKSLQAALPTPIFEVLHRVFGVSFECFASPLNCYFKQYCSAFPDTDTFFGSRGSILDFKPIKGSLQANPPWCEELIEATVDHFETLLSDTDAPLSFIMFLPNYHDPPPEFLIKAESSRFNRQRVILPPYDHEYRDGHQHISDARNAVAAHGTAVIFLQNQAGYEKWTPSPAAIEELMQASRIRS